jgi:hypothetical protein
MIRLPSECSEHSTGVFIFQHAYQDMGPTLGPALPQDLSQDPGCLRIMRNIQDILDGARDNLKTPCQLYPRKPAPDRLLIHPQPFCQGIHYHEHTGRILELMIAA